MAFGLYTSRFNAYADSTQRQDWPARLDTMIEEAISAGVRGAPYSAASRIYIGDEPWHGHFIGGAPNDNLQVNHINFGLNQPARNDVIYIPTFRDTFGPRAKRKRGVSVNSIDQQAKLDIIEKAKKFLGNIHGMSKDEVRFRTKRSHHKKKKEQTWVEKGEKIAVDALKSAAKAGWKKYSDPIKKKVAENMKNIIAKKAQQLLAGKKPAAPAKK
jgi:hypothetical protein